MTDTSYAPAPFTIAPPAPAAPAPQEYARGSLVPSSSPVGSDWSEKRRDKEATQRQELRSTIKGARTKVEARGEGAERPHMTKRERLAQAESKGTRLTGSEDERRDTRSTVRKAMEKLGYDDVSDREENVSARGEMRKAVETLEQRYPGRKASDFVKTAKDWEAAYRADPVGTREKILEQYAKVSPENFRDVKESEKAPGARGSVRQAMRDHEMMSDLAQFEKEFGNKLPAVLSELVRHDAALVNDPVGTSARLAANYSAPVTAEQQRAYEAKQAQEAHQRQDSANVHRAIELVIQHNVLPHMDDDAVLNGIADVLISPSFKRTGDRLQDLRNAHAAVMARKANSAGNRYANSGAGNRSINGAPSTSGGPGREARASQTAVGKAVSRAFNRS